MGPRERRRGAGAEGQRAEINTRHRLDQSQGALEPIGHFLSGLLKFCYVIYFSEEQRREVVCVCACVWTNQVKAGFTVTMQGCYSWNFGH